ncbi:MAG: heme exporter protein CcmB [Solirubrobacterales bacterium]
MSAKPPTLWRATLAILAKDLKLEMRSFETLTVTLIFTTATFVVFHFAFDRDQLFGSIAAGVFWVTILFASALTINRLLSNERSQGGYEALLLAPIDRNAILLAKIKFTFIALAVLELFAVLVFGLLLLGPNFDSSMLALIPVCLLANLGIATIGTLVSALATDTSARELLVPLMTLPLFTPLLIGAARATAPLFAATPHVVDLGKWLALMGLYDAVFLMLAYAVFDYIVED